MDVTDFEQEYNKGDEDEEQRNNDTSGVIDVTENTRQGPIKPGGFSHIGTFKELVERIARCENINMDGHMPQSDIEFSHITIRLIGIYGPENKPIGAERGFDLTYNEEQFSLRPASWDTKQLTSMRQRRKLHKIVESLNATNFSSSSSFSREKREKAS